LRSDFKQDSEDDLQIIDRYADDLNEEALDVLDYQDAL
jgi:hypothetical protein